jgi:hypothetical protein
MRSDHEQKHSAEQTKRGKGRCTATEAPAPAEDNPRGSKTQPKVSPLNATTLVISSWTIPNLSRSDNESTPSEDGKANTMAKGIANKGGKRNFPVRAGDGYNKRKQVVAGEHQITQPVSTRASEDERWTVLRCAADFMVVYCRVRAAHPKQRQRKTPTKGPRV